MLGVCAGLPGGRAHCAGAETNLTQKSNPVRVQGCGVWCKQFTQPVSWLSYFLQAFLFCAERQGREKVLASSFDPGEVSPLMLPLWNMLQEKQITFMLSTPGALQIVVATLYAHRQFACLLSKNNTVPFRFCLSQTCCPLKSQDLGPICCKIS